MSEAFVKTTWDEIKAGDIILTSNWKALEPQLLEQPILRIRKYRQKVYVHFEEHIVATKLRTDVTYKKV